ncbi:hypothetical protein SDC9_199922 [bioreactor metagenome]|uniref:Uncharacterized protein n=1 Tax=bioreactor metagenome TaxID=1076179 RepID=A0A645IMI2_9ZZZZ
MKAVQHKPHAQQGGKGYKYLPQHRQSEGQLVLHLRLQVHRYVFHVQSHPSASLHGHALKRPLHQRPPQQDQRGSPEYLQGHAAGRHGPRDVPAVQAQRHVLHGREGQELRYRPQGRGEEGQRHRAAGQKIRRHSGHQPHAHG